ncbi:DUF61 family protein [Methanothermococcus sp. Ax23]|jgi:uncharacterized protein (UPF0216 family)|uniref:DUF61 family protein n=1 Tax=Methanothermococcus sp. Ax23 TaxID=3156486 RepID=UPI003BA17D8B
MNDKTIYKFLHGLNTNFKRKTLKELLNEEKPHVIINGKRHRIKKRELDLLKELNVDENLKIPIVLEIDASLECGTVKIEGNEEVKVVSKILGKEINIFNEERIIYIYKPELRILRRELPTTTTYLFRMSSC